MSVPQYGTDGYSKIGIFLEYSLISFLPKIVKKGDPAIEDLAVHLIFGEQCPSS